MNSQKNLEIISSITRHNKHHCRCSVNATKARGGRDSNQRERERERERERSSRNETKAYNNTRPREERRGGRIESNRIESNQIKSNQIKSNYQRERERERGHKQDETKKHSFNKQIPATVASNSNMERSLKISIAVLMTINITGTLFFVLIFVGCSFFVFVYFSLCF